MLKSRILKIARNEGRNIVRDGRFRWASAVVLVLLGISLALGAQQYQNRENERAVAAEISRQQWEAQPARNPHGAAHFGIYVLRPFTSLSLFENGLQGFVGETAYLEAHRQNPPRYRPMEDATAVARMAELTASSILQLFLPLLIVLFAFSAFSGERERGTLRMLLSSGVAPNHLVFGKALGVAGALAILLVPATLLGLLTLSLTSNLATGDSLARMAWTLLGFTIYYLGWIALALAISARARSSMVALMAALGFWIANGFLLPVLIADLAERVHPVPSTQAFLEDLDADLAEGFDGHDLESPEALELTRKTLEKYGVETVEELPVNIAGVAFLESERQSQEVLDHHFSELATIYQRQERLSRLGALLAPFVAVRSWAMAFAGTDIFHHLNFVESAETYRREFNRLLNEALRDGSRSGEFYSAPEEFWAELPVFEYSPPSTSWVLDRNRWNLAVLLLWGVGALVAAVLATRRLEL